MELTLEQTLALNHALTALHMSRQWSKDMGFVDRIEDDEVAFHVINEMLGGTACYCEDPRWDLRNTWPRA